MHPGFPREILPGDMPFLFEGGESSWASTSAELLSSMAALQAFGFLFLGVARAGRGGLPQGLRPTTATKQFEGQGVINYWQTSHLQLQQAVTSLASLSPSWPVVF